MTETDSKTLASILLMEFVSACSSSPTMLLDDRILRLAYCAAPFIGPVTMMGAVRGDHGP